MQRDFTTLQVAADLQRKCKRLVRDLAGQRRCQGQCIGLVCGQLPLCLQLQIPPAQFQCLQGIGATPAGEGCSGAIGDQLIIDAQRTHCKRGDAHIYRECQRFGQLRRLCAVTRADGQLAETQRMNLQCAVQ